MGMRLNNYPASTLIILSVSYLGCKRYFLTTPYRFGIELVWLQTNSCPLCRFELPTDDEDYEEERKEKKRASEREVDIDNLHNSMFS